MLVDRDSSAAEQSLKGTEKFAVKLTAIATRVGHYLRVT